MQTDSKSIVVVSGWNDRFQPVADVTFPVLKDYCVLHGYQLNRVLFNDSQRNPSWQKIDALLTALRDHEWAFWVDPDSIVVDMNRKVEEFCDVPWRSACDGYGLCNSHILCQRTPDVISLLETMRFLGDPENHFLHSTRKWEQDTLKDLCMTYPSVNEIVSLFPPDTIQHGSNDGTAWIVHYPCISLTERVSMLRSARNK